jgi:hypothetical protein
MGGLGGLRPAANSFFIREVGLDLYGFLNV